MIRKRWVLHLGGFGDEPVLRVAHRTRTKLGLRKARAEDRGYVRKRYLEKRNTGRRAARLDNEIHILGRACE